jgi:hypothetical protein
VALIFPAGGRNQHERQKHHSPMYISAISRTKEGRCSGCDWDFLEKEDWERHKSIPLCDRTTLMAKRGAKLTMIPVRPWLAMQNELSRSGTSLNSQTNTIILTDSVRPTVASGMSLGRIAAKPQSDVQGTVRLTSTDTRSGSGLTDAFDEGISALPSIRRCLRCDEKRPDVLLSVKYGERFLPPELRTDDVDVQCFECGWRSSKATGERLHLQKAPSGSVLAADSLATIERTSSAISVIQPQLASCASEGGVQQEGRIVWKWLDDSLLVLGTTSGAPNASSSTTMKSFEKTISRIGPEKGMIIQTESGWTFRSLGPGTPSPSLAGSF